MSDNSKKRSRKAKLEPRDCEVEVIEDDDEEIPCSSNSETVKEYNDLAEIRLLPKTETITHEDDTPKRQFDINIEVEQFDIDSDESEGCLNIDESNEREITNDEENINASSEIVDTKQEAATLKLTTNEKHYEPNISDELITVINDDEEIEDNNKSDDTQKCDKESNITNYSLESLVDTVPITETRLIKEHEIFSQTITNPIDKQIQILTKNHLRIHKPYIFDIHDVKISEVLGTYRLWYAQSAKNREHILMYKCYICNLAWWNLYPFKMHIRIHPAEEIKLSTEASSAELNIVAYNGVQRFISLTPEGDCWQCQKSIDHFSCGTSKSSTLSAYRCQWCQEKFKICSMLQKHEGKCQRYLKQYFKDKICEPSKTCEICSVILLSNESYNKHMVLKHSVRSDLYVAGDKVKYHERCNQEYINMYYHSCPAMEWNYQCEYCDRKFCTSRLAMLHRDNGRPTKCSHCNKYLKKDCMELEHLASHTNSYVWLFMCKQCHKKLYTEEAYMKLHRTHSGNSNVHRRVLAPFYCLSPDFVKKLEEEEKERQESMKSDESVTEIQDDDTEITSKSRDSAKVTDDLDKEFEEMEMSITNALSNFKNTEDDDDIAVINDKVTDNYKKGNYNGTKRVEIEVVVKDEIVSDDEVVRDDEILEIDEDLDFKKETEELEAELSKVFKASKNITGEIIDPKSIHEEIDIKQEIKEEDDSDCYEDDIIQFNYEPKIEIDNHDIVDNDSNDDKVTYVPTTSDNKLRGVKETVCKVQSDYVEVKLNKHNNIIFKPDEMLKMAELDNNSSEPNHIKEEIPEYQELSEEEWDCVRPKKRKIRKIATKIYKCIKCDFSGLHKDYKQHVRDECRYRKRKNRPPKDNKWKSWKLFQCSRCLAENMSLNSYLIHLKLHGLPARTCPKCGLLLASEQETVEHVQDHIKSNYVRISIIRSGDVITTRNDFVYQCQQCQATVQHIHFFKHWEMHLEFNKVVTIATEKTVELPKTTDDLHSTLDKELLQKVILSLQMGKGERRQQRVYKDRICVVCDKRFDRYHDIKVHLVQHLLADAISTKKSVYELICQICGKELKDVSLYKEHLRHHGSLPVYRCLACKKSFSDSSNFAKHKKTHNLMVVICDICKKKFRSKDQLARHIQEHSTKEPIECGICKRMFFCNSDYKKHYRTRHMKKETQFKCVLCKKGFPRLRFKWDHMWEAHRIRKFNADCPICGCSFRKLSSVQRHMLAEHDKAMPPKIRNAIKNSYQRHK